MNRIGLLLTTLFLLVASSVWAQESAGIKGLIRKSDGPVAFATIDLFQHEQQEKIKTTLADVNGHFVFEAVKPGTYQVMVTAIGFETLTKTLEVINGKLTEADFDMVAEIKQLSAVTVTAQRKLIEVHADKTVINVDASPTNAGATALEVLEKSPGVLVDHNGTISLAGKEGVNVLIDGRPVSMSAADLSNYLKSLNASQVDQIELITQPSARFDAQGNAGIINIKLKRNKLKGMNGNLGASYTQGQFARYAGNGFLGYRNGKWNVSGSVNGTIHEGFNDIKVVRYFRKKEDKMLQSIFDQHTYVGYAGENFQLKASVDYLATKKTTIGANVQAGFNKIDFIIPTVVYQYDALKTYTGKAVTSGVNFQDNSNLVFNVNFKIALDSLGRTLSGDADYAQYDDDGNQWLDNYFYDADDQENASPYLLRGHNPALFNIYSAKVDYVHPFARKWKLETGVKSSYVYSDLESTFLNKNSGVWQRDQRSNHFVYEENINAAYINASKDWERLQVQVGLRAENTRAHGNQKTTNQEFDRDYTQLFPTVFASYKINDLHSVNGSWGRRITRPSYSALNPFQMLLNPYTYQTGNPLLKPQFSYNTEAGYTYKNGLLSIKASYAKITDIIADVLTQNETNTTSYVQPQNLASLTLLSLQINSSLNPAKWLSTQVFLSGNRQYFKGLLSGYYHEVNFNTFNININNQFKMGEGWSAELGGFYQHKNLFSGNSIVHPFGILNAGISKQVFNKKGTFKLTGRDILNTRNIQIDQNYHEFESYFTNRIDSRTITLGFTWRFAKNEKAVLQQRNTGASAEEINRAGKN